MSYRWEKIMDQMRSRIVHEHIRDLQQAADEIRLARTLRSVLDEPAPGRAEGVPKRRSAPCPDEIARPRPA